MVTVYLRNDDPPRNKLLMAPSTELPRRNLIEEYKRK